VSVEQRGQRAEGGAERTRGGRREETGERGGGKGEGERTRDGKEGGGWREEGRGKGRRGLGDEVEEEAGRACEPLEEAEGVVGLADEGAVHKAPSSRGCFLPAPRPGL